MGVRRTYLVFSAMRHYMTSDSYRLSILTAQEVEDIYGLPRFTDEDRRLYFDLSVTEREAINAVHSASVSVHLILQIGYFKAKRQFFIYEQDAVQEDRSARRP